MIQIDVSALPNKTGNREMYPTNKFFRQVQSWLHHAFFKPVKIGRRNNAPEWSWIEELDMEGTAKKMIVAVLAMKLRENAAPIRFSLPNWKETQAYREVQVKEVDEAGQLAFAEPGKEI